MSSSEETDDMGTGRSYECVFCKRGFTTAQALGGHMNIHRKDRANNNKVKPNFLPSSSSKVVDDNNYSDLGFYSPIPNHLVAEGNNYNNNTYYYSTITPDLEVDTTDNNYHPFYFPSHTCGTSPSSNLGNQKDRRHLFGQDWSQNLSLYTNSDKIEDNTEEGGGLDLELRLGYHP
ncbi:hypothetical protein TanjilG_24558 [Lupinus angustifolius]|uniref:C2H2-type domain-containing protein n=1 Tax=Lupinus angustifolius TaxID=3871 RepID=A0A4P1RK28_LUPAN|nr:hypothetical protein TanjilG_24558 [Lupinus angustifolius]